MTPLPGYSLLKPHNGMDNRQERPDRNDREYSENQEIGKILRLVPLLISVGEKTESAQTR
jgi:hypothetical protein